MAKITHSRLTEILNYDPETGIFTWKKDTGKMRLAGKVAGCKEPIGYLQIGVDYKLYRCHRLAWFYVHGQWPSGQIDHINLNKSDNRIANLREATAAQNKANSPKHSDSLSGFKGVTWHKQCKKWAARIRYKHLGLFPTAEEAHAAYQKAASDAFGDYARY